MIFLNIRTNFNSTFANRGMSLENDINESNKYYVDYDIALIYKKPTPIRITKTNYKNMRITDGFFESPSTLDYNGVYKGYYIEFDAKETRSKTSFPIDNIHKHQIEYIRKVIDYINNNERKSIPLSYFENNTYEIGIKYAPRLDYIKIVDKLINEHNN